MQAFRANDGNHLPIQMRRETIGAVENLTTVVIEPDGFRPNVGIILARDNGKVLWARRIRRDGWQFPQGGMNSDETPLEAMYRELHEEVGLTEGDVDVLGSTPGWLKYRLPRRYLRRNQKPMCIGQKQVWFLLQLKVPDSRLRLDATASPEFDSWRWVDFWYPVKNVVHFKRGVYRSALRLLEPHMENLAGEAFRPLRKRKNFSLNPKRRRRSWKRGRG